MENKTITIEFTEDQLDYLEWKANDLEYSTVQDLIKASLWYHWFGFPSDAKLIAILKKTKN